MTWLDLLEQAVKKNGLKVVAAELGYAPSSISLARHGRYVGSTARIEARVLELYGSWVCSHLNRTLSATECANFADRSTPTSNPQALRHWAACQECPFRRK